MFSKIAPYVKKDPLYGDISFEGVLAKIISTEEFQRLARIKQLGGVHYIHKNAIHTRTDHGMGTAYLARELLAHLKLKYPDIQIDEDDILCVQIAALCHDLGHGPFSYVYQRKLLPRIGDGSTQRERSCAIFESMWARIVAEEMDGQDPLKENDNMIFVKELILGKPCDNGAPKYVGRDGPKRFLYDILPNNFNAVNMCACDYVARDSYHTGYLDIETLRRKAKETFDKMALNENSDEVRIVCDQEHDDLITRGRYKLHSYIYQNSEVNAVEHMICDILWLVKDDYDLASIDDGILDQVLESNEEENESGEERKKRYETAKNLIRRLKEKKFYKCVKQIIMKEAKDITDDDIRKRFEKILGSEEPIESMRYSSLDYKLEQWPDTPLKVIQVFCTDQDVEKEVLSACKSLNFEKDKKIVSPDDAINLLVEVCKDHGEFFRTT